MPSQLSSYRKSSHSPSSAYLSEDLVVEILSWMPVASLLRFKSVCKSWYSVIGSSSFIRQHLRRHRHPLMDADYGLFIMDNSYLYVSRRHEFSMYDDPLLHLHSSLRCPQNCVFTRDIKLPNLSKIAYPPSTLTCDGIVCFCYVWDKNVSQDSSDDDDDDDDEYFRRADDEYFIHMILWNPSTKQFRTLPKPLLPVPQLHMSLWDLSVGLGFDILTNDYKLVLIFLYDGTSHGQTSWSRVQVYSLSTNSWRAIDSDFPIGRVTSISSIIETPYENGTYCWLATNNSEHIHNPRIYDRIILSFDFCTEKFETIPLPNDFSVKHDPFPLCALLHGNIAFINKVAPSSNTVTVDTSLSLDIWVLKEYNIKESWTKLYTIGPFMDSRPRGILKNRFLLLAKSDHFCIYDIITGESKNIVAIEENSRFYDHRRMEVAIYEESLVSVKE